MANRSPQLHILIAPDSFKGSMNSRQVSRIITEALSRQLPEAEIIQCPLADGGEGTRSILEPYMPGHVCLIESAQLIGLNLPEMCSLDVMKRGSAPLGDAILKGLEAGKREFVIGLGGSATNDCGLGMLMALGIQAFDEQGMPVEPNLAGLLTLTRVDITGLDPGLAESRLTILSDVGSPLCGKNGATAVYGPQKGVQASDVEQVDHAISAFADRCAGIFGFDPRLKEGAGAAGGLGFALLLLGGKVVSGAGYVMEKTGFYKALADTDWVITGEGCSDAQTLQGKLPFKIALAAREANVKTALLSGSVEHSACPALEACFDLVISAKPDGMESEEAMLQASSLLKKAAIRFTEKTGY
ncbi:MAG: glycerate kinase [Mariprofundaceae bacterium]|nr:glycerate kinase [Mariprofundaceae bacterium]